jgi:O-antigen ligase
MYVAVYFIVSRWYTPRVRDFGVFGVFAVIVGLIGVLQFYGWDIFKLWPVDEPEWYVENFYNIFFRSTLGNVNIVSTFVCVALLLCGFLFVCVKSKWRPVWLFAAALNFWLMELAGADSGRVGTLAGVLFALPFVVGNRGYIGRFMILGSCFAAVYSLQRQLYNVGVLGTQTAASLLPFWLAAVVLALAGVLLARNSPPPEQGAKTRWKLGVAISAGIIAAGLIGIEVLGSRVEDTGHILFQAREILHGNMRDEFGTNRGYIWRIALENFSHPILGTGPDTFLNAFPAEAQGVYGQMYDKAHNEYLQIMVCQGILGLAAYLAFLGDSLRQAVIRAFRDPMIFAALAAFVGYLAQAFFNISLPIVAQMLWILAGILVSKKEQSSVAVK